MCCCFSLRSGVCCCCSGRFHHPRTILDPYLVLGSKPGNPEPAQDSTPCRRPRKPWPLPQTRTRSPRHKNELVYEALQSDLGCREGHSEIFRAPITVPAPTDAHALVSEASTVVHSAPAESGEPNATRTRHPTSSGKAGVRFSSCNHLRLGCGTLIRGAIFLPVTPFG